MLPATPWLHRLPWDGFPGFNATMGRSDSRGPFRPLQLPSRGRTSGTLARSCFAPLPEGAAWQRPGVFFLSGSPSRASAKETSGLPGSWGSSVYVPCSQTPARSRAPTHSGLNLLPSAFLTASALATCLDFGAQSHGPHTRCVRFVTTVARVGAFSRPRNTRFRLGVSLGRVGVVTHKDPSKGFVMHISSGYMTPPFPGLAWRTRIAG